MKQREIELELIKLFEAGEARSMARIIWEDLMKGLESEKAASTFKNVISRLEAGEPVQYIIGSTIFYGFRFKVSPAVLIPRPETEELVFLIKKELTTKIHNRLKIIDIGTGSGCIAITLKKQCPDWEVYGSDISKTALEIAKSNAVSLEADVLFRELNFLDESKWDLLPGKLDVIVSNPPYIPESESVLMPDHVIQNEPKEALFVPDEDPLIFYKKIKAFAERHLKKGGLLALELNEFYAEDTKVLFKPGFDQVQVIPDLQGKKRILIAKSQL